MSDQAADGAEHVDAGRRGRFGQVAASAVATALVAALVYVALALTLGITGLLVAVVLWLGTVTAGVARWSPRGIGVAIGCLLLVVVLVVLTLLER